MTLNLSMPEQTELKPRITVFGVGGAGGNAVNNMIEKQLDGVDFVVANTDAQALQQTKAPARIQLGVKVTEGLGAGARATVGAAAAEESIEQIVDHLAGAHMCFITAGMGGGTGTGAAPIIAQAARELGVLTVGVVTKPFQFEGAKRMRQAEDGVDALQQVVDTLIIIPNQNLFRLANEKTTFTEAFSMADDVLYQGVKGVTDLMVRPGLINLDFADVRAVMDEMGKAMMGTGEAEGEDRAIQAAEKAIANPLLDEISLRGAKGVLINITGGPDLTLFELDEAANRIREEVDPEANIIVGSTLDSDMKGAMRVSVVATGIDASDGASEQSHPRRSMAAPLTPESSRPAPAPTPEPEPVYAEVAETQAEYESYETAAEDGSEGYHQHDAYERPAAELDDYREAAAHRTEMPAFRSQHDMMEEEVDAYVAPTVAPKPAPRPAPQPVHNVAPAQRPQQYATPTPAREQRAAPQPAAEQRRFGLNSLINRMTGHGGDGQEQPAQQVARAAAPMHRVEPTRGVSAEAEEEQDRIEIPAFLRRQAN
ncbi:cell division protein FtsZ [Chachezhania sediminis]|uniref:cell division protein FtsZ n=1 Tax=Chachezhania sediminis TaxID=2599291 RepID=UPI00131B3B89|nr:cell division protein FtsZ [Chachezhania sediminis]